MLATLSGRLDDDFVISEPRAPLCGCRSQAGDRQGIIPGPRVLVVTRRYRRHGQLRPQGIRSGDSGSARSRGSRRPRRAHTAFRDQIARGADWISSSRLLVGPGRGARPTFTLDEMKRIVGSCPGRRLSRGRSRYFERRNATCRSRRCRHHRARLRLATWKSSALMATARGPCAPHSPPPRP